MNLSFDLELDDRIKTENDLSIINRICAPVPSYLWANQPIGMWAVIGTHREIVG